MLVLDFINVGNGDSALIREMDDGVQKFAMLVDCGHDNLVRDDHPMDLDPQSKRIYASDFLRKQGVTHLDLLLITHFHRDHVGGLSRVLREVTVGKLLTTYVPPADAPEVKPDGDMSLPKAARNALRCLDFYVSALRANPGRVKEFVQLPGTREVRLQLTEELTMEILFGEPALYQRQKEIYDAALRGRRDGYDLVHWSKSMNASSLRQRLWYHGKEVVLGGDSYAHIWETIPVTHCEVLKVPHHASLSSTTRKLLSMLNPKTAVVSVAARRPDERPHPYVISLLREFTPDVRFTDAVEIPGLVEPEFHESVHIELE